VRLPIFESLKNSFLVITIVTDELYGPRPIDEFKLALKLSEELATLELKDTYYINLIEYWAPLRGHDHRSRFPHIPIDVPILFSLPLIISEKDVLGDLKSETPRKGSIRHTLDKTIGKIDLYSRIKGGNREKISPIRNIYRTASLRKRKKILDVFERKYREISENWQRLDNFLESEDQRIVQGKERFLEDMLEFGLDSDIVEGVFDSGLKRTWVSVQKRILRNPNSIPIFSPKTSRSGGAFCPKSLSIYLGGNYSVRVPMPVYSETEYLLTPMMLLTEDLKAVSHELKEYFMCQSITELLDHHSFIYEGLDKDERLSRSVEYFVDLVDLVMDVDLQMNPKNRKWLRELAKKWDPKYSLSDYLERAHMSRMIPKEFSSNGMVDYKGEWFLRKQYEKLRKGVSEGSDIDSVTERFQAGSDILAKTIYHKIVYDQSRFLGIKVLEGTYPNVKRKTERKLNKLVMEALQGSERPDEKLYKFVETLYSNLEGNSLMFRNMMDDMLLLYGNACPLSAMEYLFVRWAKRKMDDKL
jgi:hypothetical protein